ncbi:hypothetical protein BGZ95_009020 [Linnemannia exigua]|uniref:Uncharacterized protein n=1 Tax=Linnemannia exigua TaxID=604196 RepID=A0AAD4GZ05_9FUNG|nr:hypothetical protein BGZ95_009020 [Linnemannia exigua]
MPGAGSKLKARLLASKRALEDLECHDIKMAVVNGGLSITNKIRNLASAESLMYYDQRISDEANRVMGMMGGVDNFKATVEEFSANVETMYKDGTLSQTDYDTFQQDIKTVLDIISKYKAGECTI